MVKTLQLDEEKLEAVRVVLAGLGRPWTPQDVADALKDVGMVVSDAAVLLTVEELKRTSMGVGRLEPLLELPGLTDIIVDGPGRVLVDCGHGLRATEVKFDSDAQVRQLAVRLAASVGRRLDDSSPYADARLVDGIRFHAVLSPISAPGTCISLRVPARAGFTLENWVENGSISHATAELLGRIVSKKVAFLISGGTGSGKTTLLAGLLGIVPQNERILIVEDSRELEPEHDFCVRLESRPANSEGAGAVTMTDLVRQALRMRPDRVVVGEIRGAELCDLLRALNTGHEGGCGTVHANSAVDVPARLEALAALGGLSRQACNSQVASAIQVVIHVKRLASGRRQVAQIGLLRPRQDGMVEVVPALEAEASDPSRLKPRAAYAQLVELLDLPRVAAT